MFMSLIFVVNHIDNWSFNFVPAIFMSEQTVVRMDFDSMKTTYACVYIVDRPCQLSSYLLLLSGLFSPTCIFSQFWWITVQIASNYSKALTDSMRSVLPETSIIDKESLVIPILAFIDTSYFSYSERPIYELITRIIGTETFTGTYFAFVGFWLAILRRYAVRS